MFHLTYFREACGSKVLYFREACGSKVLVSQMYLASLMKYCLNQIILILLTLENDKVSVLTHAYPHKIVAICRHQDDSTLKMWPDVWSGDLRA